MSMKKALPLLGVVILSVGWHSQSPLATTTTAGLMSPGDKIKLASNVPPSAIQQLSTPSGGAGDVITMFGYGFTGATGFDFGGVAASSFNIVGDTVATATVPSGALSGKIHALYGTGSIASVDDFSFVDPTKLNITLGLTPPDPRLYVAGSDVELKSIGNGSASELPLLLQTSSGVADGCGGGFNVANSLDWVVRFIWSGAAGQTGYLLSAQSPNGNIALRIGGTPSAMNLISTIRGTDSTTPTSIQNLVDGDEVEIRMFSESIGGCDWFITYRVNGYQTASAFFSQGGSLGAIGTPTSFYIGSNLGSAGTGLPVQKYTYFSSQQAPHKANNSGVNNTYEFVIMGDSIADRSGQYLYKPSERYTRPGIAMNTGGGYHITDVQADWDARGVKGSAALKAAIILCGYNDIVTGCGGSGCTAAQWKTNMQALITDIHTANPTAKILLTQLTPTNAALTGAQQTVRSQINAIIADVNQLTNVDYRVTSHVALLDDGTGNYRRYYSNGDYTHPNEAGRVVIAGAWHAALQQLGLLQ